MLWTWVTHRLPQKTPPPKTRAYYYIALKFHPPSVLHKTHLWMQERDVQWYPTLIPLLSHREPELILLSYSSLHQWMLYPLFPSFSHFHSILLTFTFSQIHPRRRLSSSLSLSHWRLLPCPLISSICFFCFSNTVVLRAHFPTRAVPLLGIPSVSHEKQRLQSGPLSPAMTSQSTH